MTNTVLLTFFAGVAGTGIGGVVSIMLRGFDRVNDKVIMSLASGFMLAVAVFQLIPASLFEGGLSITLIGIVVGVILIATVDGVSRHHKGGRLGGIVAIAIALHNIPEGLAIGVVGLAGGGIGMAILIALHNIPEGMAVATPMIKEGVKSGRVIIYLMMTGLPTVIGGIIGTLLSGSGAIVSAICLAIAAGAMLYVVVFDLYKECYCKSERVGAIAISNLIGIIIGLVMIVTLG